MSFPAKKKINSALAVPPQVWDTIADIDDVNDPVVQQYKPSDLEKIISLRESADPIGDAPHSPVKGVVHRHQNRALLKITGRCSVYCRFCFRKEMVGNDKDVLNEKEIEAALDYFSAHPEIREVILTGGDPLTLSNKSLQSLLQKISAIDHIDIIRFHTRTPIVQPSRIDDVFLHLINSCPKAVYFVLHINHVQEINETVSVMLTKLAASKAILLCQSVLLKNINDNVKTLEMLFRTLIAHNVKPYYLHHLDMAPGTGHFRVPMEHGMTLMSALRQRLSGLALPGYVIDIPGGFGKVPVNNNYVTIQDDGTYLIKDYDGNIHHYDDRR